MGHIVLLVDDDKNVIHGLTRALRRQPYQLYTAQFGDEAIWILKAHDVDVIVTDEKMPGMCGCDLIAWVAQNYPDIVRIILTGHATAEMAIRAINEGAVYHFFTKPCRDVHLAIAIRKALEQRELLKENLRLRELCRGGGAMEGARGGRSRPSPGGSQRLSRDLNNLAQVISRDIQEPLRAVSDFYRARRQPDPQALNPDAKVLLDSVLNAANEAERMVTDLLRNPHPENSTGPATESGSQPGCMARSS